MLLLLPETTLSDCLVSLGAGRRYYVITDWYQTLISCGRSFFLGFLTRKDSNLNFACLPLNWKNHVSLALLHISSDWWWILKRLSHLLLHLQSGKCCVRIQRSFARVLYHLGINLCHLMIYDDFYFFWIIMSHLVNINSNISFLMKMSGTVFLRNKRIFLGGHDSISNISVPFYEGSWEGESD